MTLLISYPNVLCDVKIFNDGRNFEKKRKFHFVMDAL